MNPIRRLISRRKLLLAAAAGTVTPAALSQSADRLIPVTPGGDNDTPGYEGEISEYEADAYVVSLRRGQSLHVLLATNNASNCFDIHAPGEARPVYVGAESGNTCQLLARTSGEYTVRVFLLRLAARDGQSARYTLELKVTG
jgi:hypothetical protein